MAPLRSYSRKQTPNVLPILLKHHVNTAPVGLATTLVILCAHAAELYHPIGMLVKSGGGLVELLEVIGNLIGAYSNQWGGEGFEQGQINKLLLAG